MRTSGIARSTHQPAICVSCDVTGSMPKSVVMLLIGGSHSNNASFLLIAGRIPTHFQLYDIDVHQHVCACQKVPHKSSVGMTVLHCIAKHHAVIHMVIFDVLCDEHQPMSSLAAVGSDHM